MVEPVAFSTEILATNGVDVVQVCANGGAFIC